MSTNKIYDDVLAERKLQDAEHGGAAHDDEHSVNDFIAYICKQAGKAVDGSIAHQRQQMIRVAALAFAVVEKLDRQTA